jgi:hypothetical protein
MYRMNNLVEILIGLILIFLVVGQPKLLRKSTQTLMGKIVFLGLAVGASFRSLYAGLLVAAIYMVLHKDYMLVENMDNMDNDKDHDQDQDQDKDKDQDNNEKTTVDFVKKYCKNGKIDESLNPPTLKYKKEKCNPCDESCDFEVTHSKEQMSVDEALRPKESNTIPV